MSKLDPRLPVVGDILRSRGRLVEIIVPPPVQPPTQYVFHDVEFKIVLMSGEQQIKEFTTYNNLYKDCIDSCLISAKSVLSDPKWNIPNSGFHVEIVETIYSDRRCVLENCRPLGGDIRDPDFVRFEGRSYGGGEVSKRVIWSSKDPDANPTPSPEFAWWNQPHWENKP